MPTEFKTLFLCILSEALKGDCVGGLIFVTVMLRYNAQAIEFTHRTYVLRALTIGF